jgi:hypothetical protein
MSHRAEPLVALALLSALTLAACSDAPSEPGGGGGGGGGPVGSVSIGPGIVFSSLHNGTANPAVDTIQVGGTVTWTWSGNLPHGVQSIGEPSFASSGIRTGAGTYAVTFAVPGTYRYDCQEHGMAMTGRIVVLPAEGTDERVSSTVTDPVGDTFAAAGTRWDLTALTIVRDHEAITARLDFTSDVVSPATGNPSAAIALLGFDLDQDAATGIPSVVDEFRHDGGATGLGVDAYVSFGQLDADGSAPVLDAQGRELGRVVPAFEDAHIVVDIPLALLADDDGFVSAAAIVGIVGSPTDFAPNAGHLALSPPGS